MPRICGCCERGVEAVEAILRLWLAARLETFGLKFQAGLARPDVNVELHEGSIDVSLMIGESKLSFDINDPKEAKRA